MKFGVSYNTGFLGSDPDRLIAVARHAEDCGFESFYVPEHIVLYPGAMLGRTPIPPALPFADPLEVLGFVAAATRRILLGTGVLLLPYHHPVVLAKRLATIDVLSKGRMRLLTVGLGTLPGEAAAAGVDFATRGRRASSKSWKAFCGRPESRSSLASRTASSIASEAPCPEVGDGAWAASPITIIRSVCQLGRCGRA